MRAKPRRLTQRKKMRNARSTALAKIPNFPSILSKIQIILSMAGGGYEGGEGGLESKIFQLRPFSFYLHLNWKVISEEIDIILMTASIH